MNYRLYAAVLVLPLLGCGSDSHTERTATARAAVSTGALTPVPCSNGLSLWDTGTIAELLFADALVECSAIAPPTSNNCNSQPVSTGCDGTYGDLPALTNGDLYEQRVVQHMQSALVDYLPVVTAGSPPPSLAQDWHHLRNDPNSTCDQTTMALSSTPAAWTPYNIPQLLTGQSIGQIPAEDPYNGQEPWANYDLQFAPLNLCIAQALRVWVPGATGGESLLFPAYEQRELLEVIRERSQMAMLQYALLGEVFASNITPGNNYSEYETSGLLSLWSQQQQNARWLGPMGNDFATAVQLNHTVADEILELTSRSRDSDTSATPPTATRADQYWTTGSWYQRGMAAGFGGDPLVMSSPSAAWPQVVSATQPGTYSGVSWPDVFESPYVHTYIDTPQVWELLTFAKSFNVLNLSLINGTNVDIPTSAKNLYNAVEAQLEYQACYGQTPPNCPTAPPTTVPPTGQPYLLQAGYNITLDNATTLASLVQDAAFSSDEFFAPEVADPTSIVVGALDTAGINPTTGVSRNVSYSSLHIDGNVAFVPRTLAEIGGVYSKAAPFRFPVTSEIAANIDSGSQGLGGQCDDQGTCSAPTANNAAEAKRTLGALSADAATRDMILDAYTYAGTSGRSDLQGSYFANASNMLSVLSGAVGTDDVRIVPTVVPTASSSGYNYYTVARYVLRGCLTCAPTPSWNVTVTHAANDPFWQAGSLTLYAVQGLSATNLAAHPEVSWNGQTLSSLLSASAFAVPTSSTANSYAGETQTIFTSLPISSDGTYALVLAATTSSANSPPTTAYRLVAGQVYLQSTAHYGQNLAFGGTLGGWLQHQATPDPNNPMEPAYDGFDLPIKWVPPFSAEVLGGTPGDSVASTYLGLANDAATQASMAVQTALTNLLQVQQGGAAIQAASAQSSQEFSQDASGLCGGNNMSCDTTYSSTTLSVLQNAPGFPPASTWQFTCPQGFNWLIFGCSLQQSVSQVISSFLATQVNIATPVLQSLNQTSQPAFDQYAGGQLQGDFITQWNDLGQGAKAVNALLAAQTTAITAVNLATNELQGANAQYNAQCNSTQQGFNLFNDVVVPAANFAIDAASAVATGGATAGMAAGGLQQLTGGVQSYLSYQGSCNALSQNLTTAQQGIVLAQNQALQGLADAVVQLQQLEGQIATSGATILADDNKAQLANAKAALESQLTAQTQQTSFGIYRLYHDYDTWQAMAMVENARQYANAARRAVEVQYVVDLSQLAQQEAFVAGPANWANDVYAYDLSLPSAVGLAVGDSTSNPTPGGIYQNQVSAYVTNLQGFVSGFAVSRPSAVDQSEIDVVSLPGLQPGSPTQVCETVSNTTGACEGLSTSVCTIPGSGVANCTDTSGGGYSAQCCASAYPAVANWNLHCPGNGSGDVWLPAPMTTTADVQGPDTACADVDGPSGPAHPDAARLDFSLDPWGRLNGATTNPPVTLRYNTRWTQLAVNFVGTGVKNCVLAADPQGCYQSDYIPYNLTQSGSSWLTDYNELWHSLDTPTGQIEQAKGIAAEVWLDPLQDGWNSTLVSAVARTEYELRPLGGTYVLEFPVGPEVVLGNIQRMQILVGSQAWVKQQ